MNRQIYEEASEWLVELRLGELDGAARERLDAWFRASPENLRAFLELSSLWEQGADPELDRTRSTEELIARARGGAADVVVLGARPVELISTPRSLSDSLDQPFSSASEVSAQTAGQDAPVAVVGLQTTPAATPSSRVRHFSVAACPPRSISACT